MAEFKARQPSVFSPYSNDYHAFSDWRKDFENYVAVTNFFNDDVTIPLQQARLYNIAGADFAKFVRQHVTVDNLIPVAMILDGVANSLKPKRFNLQNREKLLNLRQSQVSASKFLEEIRELYDLSNYGDTIARDTLIRDIFIAGIASKEARCLIYQQNSDDLTTAQCLHLVSSFESVTSTTLFPPNSADITVNAVRTNAQQVWKCFGCGSTSQHPRSRCPAFKTACHNCTKIGHFAKVCRQPRRSVDTIATEDNSTINTLFVNSIHSNVKKQSLPASINGKKIPSMLVDTGADITVLSQQLCHKLALQFKRCSFPPKAVGASGNAIKIIGRIVNACIEINGHFFIDTVWVAQHLNSDAILGRSSLSAFQALTIQYGGHLSPLQVQGVSLVPSKFVDCNPASCFPSIPTTPIRAPSRRHSLEDQRFMKNEVTRLLS